MQAAGIHNVEIIFLLLLLFVAGLAALAKRFHIPYPIVLVIGGLILSFFP
jgi:CPA1 family monovalent cation:H+ antiporter